MLTVKEQEAAVNHSRPLVDRDLKWQQIRLTIRDIKVIVHVHQGKIHSLECEDSQGNRCGIDAKRLN
jgi:hypothetical protein